MAKIDYRCISAESRVAVSQKIIDEHFAELPASARQKITCDNAGRLYGWIS